jgi:FtsP/CotA-like multicopper oxidase with cupredoxin domain
MHPGPTIVARYGRPILVRMYNELPAFNSGFGSPEISIHLHNGHIPSESDGFTGDYFSPTKFGPGLTRGGKFRDHHYPNAYAGQDKYPATDGDPREALGTLWYHDHREEFTAPNVYRGLAGFYLLFDQIDSGNEQDTNPKALRLPSGVGKYDIPLMFTDPQFNSSGYLHFDQFETDGVLGEKFAVNGKIQPYYSVARRKYRFRLLNASIARFYEFFIVLNGERKPIDQSFIYIANDGNLLPAPLTMKSIRIAPAERADIILDFSKFNIGDKVYIVNRLKQDDGRQPGGLANPGQGTEILRFDIDRDEPDYSQVPAKLRDLPPINLGEVVKQRHWEFDRERGFWTVNNKIFDIEKPAAVIKKGTAEIWTLEGKGSWQHPVHIHLEEFRILTRNGKPPPLHEQGRKDVVVLHPGEIVRIFIRFRDYTGKYMMHCHNITHEDHGMMVRFDVV